MMGPLTTAHLRGDHDRRPVGAPGVSRIRLGSAPTRLLGQPSEKALASPSIPRASRRTCASWRAWAPVPSRSRTRGRSRPSRTAVGCRRSRAWIKCGSSGFFSACWPARRQDGRCPRWRGRLPAGLRPRRAPVVRAPLAQRSSPMDGPRNGRGLERSSAGIGRRAQVPVRGPGARAVGELQDPFTETATGPSPGRAARLPRHRQVAPPCAGLTLGRFPGQGRVSVGLPCLSDPAPGHRGVAPSRLVEPPSVSDAPFG